MMQGRQRAQVMVLFALAFPAFAGFLGLALDGGYILAGQRGVQFAADAAVWASAIDIREGRGSSATTSGQAVGMANMNQLKLTGVSITIQCHTSANASATARNWASCPLSGTQSVKATATGTYHTAFMQLLQVPTKVLEGTAVVTRTSQVAPLGICDTRLTTAASANPNAPNTWQLVWTDDMKDDVCGEGNPSWDGLVNLDDRTQIQCDVYESRIIPRLSSPAFSDGDTVALNTRSCPSIGDQPSDWLRRYDGQTVAVAVVDADWRDASNPVGVIVGCVQARLFVDAPSRKRHDNAVRALPLASAPTSCSSIPTKLVQIS
jgi:Flp pilus assembly protein TadG